MTTSILLWCPDMDISTVAPNILCNTLEWFTIHVRTPFELKDKSEVGPIIWAVGIPHIFYF